MNPPHEQDLFADALDRFGQERAVWLDRACAGRPGVRARLEQLIEAYERAGDFLENPVVGRTVLPPEEKPGDVIGRYTLLRKIGEGGCGSIYLAAQKEPVRRQVALKVIKLGMDTRQVITRFEGERQALALMDHPDIARVFDAGATDTGRPYFVMEFVAGVPINRFCTEHRLALSARLSLFVRVCLALQHAHQKGIIHRDIKPSNILVAWHDGVPGPKLIDFGIAKAMQERLTDHTLVTGIDQFIGTPAYMSPEQADRRELDIDTRSDVYALGVLLYELLSDRLPFDPETLGQGGVAEIRRIIREVEPPRPSARVGLAAGPGRIRAAQLRGDLDWIVMRCLEKDRARRYGSAQELADDVRRHLGREPVVARPPTAGYRLGRFAARHRVACASAALIAATLVIGTVVSVQQAVRATRAGRAEAVARADAQRRQDQAEDLLAFMLGDFRTELQKIGRLQLLDTVGEKALAYFAALDPRDLTDTALARQAKALTQIGETRMDEARYPEAAAAFAAAYDRADALTARHPQDGDMLFERAQAEYWLAFVARRRGDFAAQRAWFTRYRDSAVRLVALEGPAGRAQHELTYGHHNLAVLELDDGHLVAAREEFLAERAAFEQMRATVPDDSSLRYELAVNASWLGTVAEQAGDYPEAIERFTEMAAGLEELLAQDPAVARWQFELVQALTFVGDLQALTGRRTEAAAAYARATARLDPLVTRDPDNRQWQLAALKLGLRAVSLHLAAGRLAAVGPVLAEVRRKLEVFVQAEPSSQPFARQLARVWQLEGGWRLAAGRADATAAIDAALGLGETLVQQTRADVATRTEFAQTLVLAGRIALAQSRLGEARRHWQRALEMLAPRLADSSDWRLLDPAVQALSLLGRADEARPLIARLQRLGYHPLNPLAASLLEAPAASGRATQTQ